MVKNENENNDESSVRSASESSTAASFKSHSDDGAGSISNSSGGSFSENNLQSLNTLDGNGGGSGICGIASRSVGTSSQTGGADGTQVGTVTNNSSNDEYKQIRNYALAETNRVDAWRLVVIVSLVIAGIAVSTLTYKTLQHEVYRNTDEKFDAFAKTIGDALTFQVTSIVDAHRALSSSISTAAITTNQEFPYVTIPAFEQRAYEVRKETGVIEVYFAPTVPISNKERWLNYSITHQGWIEESKGLFDMLQPGLDRSSEPIRGPIDNVIWSFDTNNTTDHQRIVPSTSVDNDNTNDPYSNNITVIVPIFHTSPPPLATKTEFQNIDMFTNDVYRTASMAALTLMDITFTPMEVQDSDVDGLVGQPYTRPYSVSVHPVFDNIGLKGASTTRNVVGFVYAIIPWELYLVKLVPKDVEGIIVVLRNSCGQNRTYELRYNEEPIFLGEGSNQDPTFNDGHRTVDLYNISKVLPEGAASVDEHCQFYLDVYSSEKFEEANCSHVPEIFAGITGGLFVLMILVFVLYDYLVKNRNDEVVNAAARSNAIVSSLFPSNVRARLMADQEVEWKQNKNGMKNTTLRGFLTNGSKASDDDDDDDDLDEKMYATKPIADLFPETTVSFADIVGFTAWSSVREPTQVFTLLETIYHAFDEIAKRRRVFKVETVGDCYVAVVGLPEPRHDHPVVMSRFARDCMIRMWTLTKKLETTLGPDTGDLTMRMGLHSGPVTAGVLRGERSRFQLFGDTMNTCARIESTGQKSCIHISEETANLLIKAGKSSWVKPREDAVFAKGKGQMKTFWLDVLDRVEHSSSNPSDTRVLDGKERRSGSNAWNSDTASVGTSRDFLSDKHTRLVSWNLEVLVRLLKQIVASRIASGRKFIAPDDTGLVPTDVKSVLEEVKEIITLPKFDATATSNQTINDIELECEVVEQLGDFITRIAKMYRDNPFHNFDHASHVTMSVVKLLSRIVAPSESDKANMSGADASTLHDHTYGITSDPLTQFSCVLSALIHDVDHPGVPNAQLVKEKAAIADKYRYQSVAEQNSVDIAFNFLMEDKYLKLRRTIYGDEAEMKRFRQLVVNSVMATDIVDKELKSLRNARWEKAFSDNSGTNEDENDQDNVNRKATIVIEHLIQASDVSHTMQHWHIYRKWNEHFFFECYHAYKMGRADADPSENWYHGEIGFFDFYIIPLAKKLKNCGVFGVSSDEYLNYATKNRAEWESRGREIVADMVERVNKIWQSNEQGSAKENKEESTQQSDPPPEAAPLISVVVDLEGGQSK